jgi:methionine sulfoxide reductase heme-binding subunit
MRTRAVPLAIITTALTGSAGFLAVRMLGSSFANRMLPWVLGRGLGIAGYLCLVTLTGLGLWLHHPWRVRFRRPAVQAQLRMHATLAALTLVVIAGHVVALVLDRYAGVGVRGAVVPGAASYRPVAVGIGTASLYLGVLIGVSAALAGRVARRAWLPIHRLAGVAFVGVWLHAVLAGSDSARLSVLYVATGAAVAVLAVTRRLAAAPLSQPAGSR